jgi:hypothetical protein
MKNGLVVGRLGTKSWFKDDKLYREDGPSVEYANGSRYWYINDELHRDDGPAVENANGTVGWYLNGVEYAEEEHPFNKFILEHKLPPNKEQWPEDMKVLFKLCI